MLVYRHSLTQFARFLLPSGRVLCTVGLVYDQTLLASLPFFPSIHRGHIPVPYAPYAPAIFVVILHASVESA